MSFSLERTGASCYMCTILHEANLLFKEDTFPSLRVEDVKVEDAIAVADARDPIKSAELRDHLVSENTTF